MFSAQYSLDINANSERDTEQSAEFQTHLGLNPREDLLTVQSKGSQLCFFYAITIMNKNKTLSSELQKNALRMLV